MARPRKGTKADIEATAKWRHTMLEKYGGEEGLHKLMQRIGAKGGRNGHTGGFASNPALARIAGAKGGRMSSRKGIKNGEGKSSLKEIEKAEKVLEEESKK